MMAVVQESNQELCSGHAHTVVFPDRTAFPTAIPQQSGGDTRIDDDLVCDDCLPASSSHGPSATVFKEDTDSSEGESAGSEIDGEAVARAAIAWRQRKTMSRGTGSRAGDEQSV